MAGYGMHEFEDPYSTKRMKNNQGLSVSVVKNNTPSKVVHVRNLPAHVSDSDLVHSLSKFGEISYVLNFPAKSMALIEFETMDSAIRLITYAKENEIPVAGLPAHFNYSVSDRIKRQDHNGVAKYEIKPSNVILLTIINARHPITVDVIHAIASPIADVAKIVIFRKNGVQVLIEFTSVEDALKAKNGLHGADIYANSCTIKAEFGKPTSLTVKKNDQNTWDYSAGPPVPNNFPKNKPLLAEPDPMANFGGFPGAPPSLGTSGFRMDFDPTLMETFGAPMPTMETANPNCVLMVYGLNCEKINCQKLFNLVCLYGDVVKIRFLKSKDGAAMLQMTDRDSCDRVMMMLRDVTIFGSKLSISNSKQPYVSESNSPSFSLPDGSPSFLDFSGSKNNRFGHPDAAKKYRVQFPTKVMYFFNAPPNVDEETIMYPFIKNGAVPPSKMVMLPARSERSSRGYLTFNDATTAVESLLVANNAKLPHPTGGHPYILKLAFSAANPED